MLLDDNHICDGWIHLKLLQVQVLVLRVLAYSHAAMAKMSAAVRLLRCFEQSVNSGSWLHSCFAFFDIRWQSNLSEMH